MTGRALPVEDRSNVHHPLGLILAKPDAAHAKETHAMETHAKENRSVRKPLDPDARVRYQKWTGFA
jgi:hypothetical protein